MENEATIPISDSVPRNGWFIAYKDYNGFPVPFLVLYGGKHEMWIRVDDDPSLARQYEKIRGVFFPGQPRRSF